MQFSAMSHRLVAFRQTVVEGEKEPAAQHAPLLQLVLVGKVGAVLGVYVVGLGE